MGIPFWKPYESQTSPPPVCGVANACWGTPVAGLTGQRISSWPGHQELDKDCMGHHGAKRILKLPGLLVAFHIFVKGQGSWLLKFGGSIMDLLLGQVGETFSQTIPAATVWQFVHVWRDIRLILYIYFFGVAMCGLWLLFSQPGKQHARGSQQRHMVLLEVDLAPGPWLSKR